MPNAPWQCPAVYLTMLVRLEPQPQPPYGIEGSIRPLISFAVQVMNWNFSLYHQNRSRRQLLYAVLKRQPSLSYLPILAPDAALRINMVGGLPRLDPSAKQRQQQRQKETQVFLQQIYTLLTCLGYFSRYLIFKYTAVVSLICGLSYEPKNKIYARYNVFCKYKRV